MLVSRILNNRKNIPNAERYRLTKNLFFSFLCLGIALFIFLFASVERIELEANAPGGLSNQKALEVAKGRGLWPFLVNFGMTQNLYHAPKIEDSHLIRYVDVAYLGNIIVLTLFLVTSLILYVHSSWYKISD